MIKNIAILYGGRSGEHDVSLLSAASVVCHIDTDNYAVILIGISMGGLWYLQEKSLVDDVRAGIKNLSITEDESRRIMIKPGGSSADCFLCSDGSSLQIDMVFPVLHGSYGEDGTVQGLLEMTAIPYIGASVLGSALGMDKELCKALWKQAGLPVVPYLALHAYQWKSAESRVSVLEAIKKEFSYPLFIKPSCAGSSVGTAKVRSEEELATAIDAAFEWDDKVLVEPFIPAREIECSITGNDYPEAYTPGEIIPHHEFYDYDAKYSDPDGAALLIPADMNKEQLDEVRNLALRAYRTLELNGLARMDFFIHRETGKLLLNEVNTMPGFTAISMFPKMCEASGLSYTQLLDKLVLLAEERHALRIQRTYIRKQGNR